MRYVTLTGHLHDAQGADAHGWVRVAGLDQTLIPEADVVIGVQPVDQELVDGRFSIPIETFTEPESDVPVFIEVHVLLDGARPKSDILNVQTTADTIDYADAPRVLLVPADGSGVTVVPWSAVGAPLGVAPLGSDRRVPSRFLPLGEGGTAGTLDELDDVENPADAPVGSVLKKGVDGIYRPSTDLAQRGDALFLRAAAPVTADGFVENDVWIDSRNGDFAVYQVEES